MTKTTETQLAVHEQRITAPNYRLLAGAVPSSTAYYLNTGAFITGIGVIYNLNEMSPALIFAIPQGL